MILKLNENLQQQSPTFVRFHVSTTFMLRIQSLPDLFSVPKIYKTKIIDKLMTIENDFYQISECLVNELCTT